MELLYFKYKESYTIQVSSTDISSSWKKFKVRASHVQPQYYGSYVLESGGLLYLWNCEENKLDYVDEDSWSNTLPVFFEDHKYTISLTFFDAKEQPHIIHPNKEVESMFNCIKISSSTYIVNSNIDFLNQPGHFALEFEYKNTSNHIVRHKLEFDVLSPKLDTKHDLDIIIQQIREEYGDLVFRYLTLTFQQFKIGHEVNNDLIWLSVFKQIVDNFINAIRFIIRQPHNKMCEYEEYSKAEHIKEWHPYHAEQFILDFMNDKAKALHSYYRTERIVETSDTKENRFVKFTLDRIIERLSLMYNKLLIGTSDNELFMLKDKLAELKILRYSSFFKGVSHFDGFQQQSLVLEQRSGYSQVYRYWIMLQNGLDLIQGNTPIGVQPIWKLYELWCFLRVKQIVCKVLGIDTRNNEHLRKYIHEDIKNAFDLFNGGSLTGSITYINPNNFDQIEIGYQYSFNRNMRKDEMRSATTEQKPDIVMHIHKQNRNISLTYLFDAKYRVNGDTDNQNPELVDEPVPETLDVMHHYRDAIYYGKYGDQKFSKEVIGGYILFPGRMDERRMLNLMNTNDIKLPYYLRSILEVNIGAYPLLPNTDSGLLLENHLRNVLLNESVIEQIEDSVPQRGLYYIDTKPSTVESKNILTVSVRKSDKDYDLFKQHKARKYVMETLPKNNILGAKYLLPMVGGDINSYYLITGLTIEDGKMTFKIAKPILLGDVWINIYQNMRHGELISKENMIKLYEYRI